MSLDVCSAQIIRKNVQFFEAIPGGRGPWTPLHPYQGSTPPYASVSVSIPGHNGSEKEFKPGGCTEMLAWGKSGRRLGWTINAKTRGVSVTWCGFTDLVVWVNGRRFRRSGNGRAGTSALRVFLNSTLFGRSSASCPRTCLSLQPVATNPSQRRATDKKTPYSWQRLTYYCDGSLEHRSHVLYLVQDLV